MEVNREEALRCISIAKNREARGEYAAALKFIKKSLSLYPTQEAKDYLERIQKVAENDKGKGETKSEGNIGDKKEKVKEKNDSDKGQNQKRAYTKEQVEAVLKIKKNAGDFYKILNLERTATEIEIKKSYRKLALQFHPDKNSAPGADEAFKLVNKAFSILSDPNNRAQYDRYGGDPEQRGGSTSSDFHHPFAHAQEINPEDIFNMFFNGGAFNTHFHSTFVGPDGRRYMRRTRPTTQARQSNGVDDNPFNLTYLLPAILFIVLSFVVQSLSPVSVREPDYTFRRTPRYSRAYYTSERGIGYYANPVEYENYKSRITDYRFRAFEREIEHYYIQRVYQLCQNERYDLQKKQAQAAGWFGWNRDETKLEELKKVRLPKCEEYARLNNP